MNLNGQHRAPRSPCVPWWLAAWVMVCSAAVAGCAAALVLIQGTALEESIAYDDFMMRTTCAVIECTTEVSNDR